MTSDTRVCPRCNGGKITDFSFEGRDWPRPVRECYACEGAGEFAAPDESAIRALVINPKTGKTFSTSLHSKAGRKRASAMGLMPAMRRAQYVWRTARWHSGADGNGYNLSGAIMADMDLGADPFKPELDSLADKIAEECHGSHMRAARRWSQALYGR